MFYTYILQSEKTCKYYIGSTSDIDARIKRHNSNKNKSTRLQGPWILRYQETFTNKEDSYRREMQIKSYKGGAAFKKLV